MTEKKQPDERNRRMNLLKWISQMDNSDVDGSYTGTAQDGSEPVQDADDL